MRATSLLLLCALPAFAPVLPAQVATVEVTPTRASVVAGGKIRFQAVARDAAGAAVATPVMWIATPFDIAGADATGDVNTSRAGRVYVIALAGGKAGMAVLDIAERGPARLIITPPARAEVLVGGTLQLTAAAHTELGDPIPNLAVRWRSLTPAIADVSPSGLTMARAAGAARVRAEVGGLTAELPIMVRANPVRSLVIEPVTSPVRTGDVVTLRAVARDASRRVVDVPVQWSVSGSRASVDESGRFVAAAPGAHQITAFAGSVAATTGVQVAPRRDPRAVEKVAHLPLGKDIQTAELWPIGDVLYVSTIADRVYVFDISNPAAPQLTDSLLVDARLVNDVSTTADGRIGVLTREGASSRKNGIVFFDASDPRHPKVLSEFTETVSGGVHSAFVYDHYVFATDDATGSLRIIDFGDPRNPKQVARWEVPMDVKAVEGPFGPFSIGRSLHDVYVEDGLAYLAYWRHGLVILDVGKGIKGGSITRPQLVSQLVYDIGGSYPPDWVAGTHAVFRYGNYVFLGDESLPGTFDLTSRERLPTRGLLHVVDVRNIEQPKKVAEYDPVEFGVHNLYVQDDVAYIGAYDGGIRVLDVSGELSGDLREQGRVIGALDTGSLAGYRPNQALTWSAIPHKGFILATDINSGLWVARLARPPMP